MNEALLRVFQQLEKQRLQLMARLATVPEEKLNQSPGAKWSPNQILAHIITSEKLSLQYMQKKYLGVEDAGDTGIKEEVVMVVLKLSQRMPGVKFRAPRLVAEQTPSIHSFQQIRKEWESQRKQMEVFLHSIPDKYVNRKIYKHPVAGRLNSRQALLFFREHIIHHIPQIQRRIK